MKTCDYMKRFFVCFFLITAGLATTSCGDFFDDFIDNYLGEEDGDEEDDGNVDEPDDQLGQAEVIYPIDKYDYFVKSMISSPSLISDEYSMDAILHLNHIHSSFRYDKQGRPVEVDRRSSAKLAGLTSVETRYMFTYGDDHSAVLEEHRIDYNHDSDELVDGIVHEYPISTYSFAPFSCMKQMSSQYANTNFIHDNEGKLHECIVDRRPVEDKVEYTEFLYDESGYLSGINGISYFPEFLELWGESMPSSSNVDFNMILLKSDFLDYNFGGSLPMILRMGGNVGDYLMTRYFYHSGEMGHGYYGYFPADKAGQTIHYTGRYIAYNEGWQGGNVGYLIEDGLVKRMSVALPVTYYEYEYDVVVSTEPLEHDPHTYPAESIGNETIKVLSRYDAVYDYEFTYYTKDEVVSAGI